MVATSRYKPIDGCAAKMISFDELYAAPLYPSDVSQNV